MPARITHQHNTALALIFQQMANCYRYLGAKERFRAAAYERASRVLRNMKEDISVHASDIHSLDAVSSIGESIAAKILEYLQTGKIMAFEKLKNKVPFQLLALLDITGFGPATLKLLHDKLGIRNKDELVKALVDGRLNNLEGFGEKRTDNLKKALKLFKDDTRMPYAVALKTGQSVLAAVRGIPGVQRAELAGSLRRKKETIGDIDILVMAPPSRQAGIINRFVRSSFVNRVLAKGNTKASVLLKQKDTQVDLRVVNKDAFGAAWLYLTGSKEYNLKLRMIAKEHDMKLNEYGLFKADSGEKLAGETEEEVCLALSIPCIPPEQRTGAFVS